MGDSVATDKKKSKGTQEEVLTDIESGLDQSMEYTLPVDSSGYDERGKKANATDLREIPRNGFFEADRPSVRQLSAMRRTDGQARALYRLITLPLRAALEGSKFNAVDGGEEEAAFINDALLTSIENGGMSVTFHRFMAQLLLALFDGYAVFEKVFWVPEKGPLKGKVTLRKLAYRPAETVTFLADDHGGFAGFKQTFRSHKGEESTIVPVPYSFYYAAQEEERKFYGVSYFESAFYHYDKKVRLYFTSHLAAQRAAVPTRFGSYPSNAPKTQKDEFNSQLSSLSMAQWMSAPEGWKVELLREGGSFDFLGYINHHNNQMSKSILAGFFDKDTGAGKNEGSFVNFVTPGQDMFMLMLRAIQDEIASQINHYIIPQLIDLNFKSEKYPKFEWGNLTDQQKEAVAATFDKLVTNPQNITPEFIRELEKKVAEELSLEIDYSEIPLAGQNFAGDFSPEDAAMDANGVPLEGEQGADGQTPTEGASIPAEGGTEALQSDVVRQFEEALLGIRDGQVELSAETTIGQSDVLDLASDFIVAAEEEVFLSSGDEPRVATAKGVKRYGAPIGTPISEGDGDKGVSKPVTLERLRSLQRQFAVAKKFGNTLLMSRVRDSFRDAVTDYSKGKSVREIQDVLNSMNSKGSLQALNPLSEDKYTPKAKK